MIGGSTNKLGIICHLVKIYIDLLNTIKRNDFGNYHDLYLLTDTFLPAWMSSFGSQKYVVVNTVWKRKMERNPKRLEDFKLIKKTLTLEKFQ